MATTLLRLAPEVGNRHGDQRIHARRQVERETHGEDERQRAAEPIAGEPCGDRRRVGRARRRKGRFGVRRALDQKRSLRIRGPQASRVVASLKVEFRLEAYAALRERGIHRHRDAEAHPSSIDRQRLTGREAKRTLFAGGILDFADLETRRRRDREGRRHQGARLRLVRVHVPAVGDVGGQHDFEHALRSGIVRALDAERDDRVRYRWGIRRARAAGRRQP